MAELSVRTREMMEAADRARAARRRMLLLGGVAAFCAAAAAGTIWILRPREKAPPPPAAVQTDPLAVVRFVASDVFAKLPEAEKLAYAGRLEEAIPTLLEAYRDGRIDDDLRRSAMRNIGPVIMRKRLDEYFALPPGPQRTAYMDRQIDQMEQQRALVEAARAARAARNSPAEGGGQQQQQDQPRGPARWMASAAAMKERLESIPPDQQARMAEFINDMRKRREERGLPPFGPFGR